MSSLSFPDVNVWLALILGHHKHRHSALRWWDGAEGVIAFSRLTQLSVLRLLTTSAVMDGNPLTSGRAWGIYDKFFSDSRVAFLPEPPDLEQELRQKTKAEAASPKVWADAFLIALAIGHGAQIISFDRAMETRFAGCLILE